MPFYEYECSKCGDKFEFLHLGKDDTVKCEKCGTKKVKKLFSSFGFGFKGFETSYGPPDSGTAADSGEEPAHGGGCCSDGSCGCG